MRKTTLEFDEELFQRAREVLGTHGLKATVQRAFQEVLALHARRQAIRQLQEMEGLDLDRPEVMAEAWRCRRATLPTRAPSSGCAIPR